MTMDTLHEDLATVLNKHSAENASDTPDFILAEFLLICLTAFDKACTQREAWYQRTDTPSTLDEEAP